MNHGRHYQLYDLFIGVYTLIIEFLTMPVEHMLTSYPMSFPTLEKQTLACLDLQDLASAQWL